MIFARQLLLAGCAVVFLCGLGARPLAAQASSAPSAPAQAAAAPANPQQAYTLPSDKLAKAIALTRIEDILAVILPLWELAVLWFLLSSRSMASLEAWASRLSGRRWLQGVCFFIPFLFIIVACHSALRRLCPPCEPRLRHQRAGLGRLAGRPAQGPRPHSVLGTLLLLFFHWIVRRWPHSYWFGAWLVTIPLLIVSVFLEPLVIDPIFNKFEPLAKTNPALVTQLEKVVARTGTDIPPDRMFLMKASEKTNGLNAYVTGIGASKRVVVWDTTAGRIPDDEILFIFGHESGHYVLRHIPKGIAVSVFALFFVYWACAAFAAWLVGRFGLRWGILSAQDTAQPAPWQSSRVGFVVLLFVVYLANFLLEPASNAFSRYFEHQADVYGQEAIRGIVSDPQATAVAAFNALGEAWLEDPNPNRLVVFWLYDHPSTQRRAGFARDYNPWTNGGRGEFFAK